MSIPFWIFFTNSNFNYCLKRTTRFYLAAFILIYIILISLLIYPLLLCRLIVSYERRCPLWPLWCCVLLLLIRSWAALPLLSVTKYSCVWLLKVISPEITLIELLEEMVLIEKDKSVAPVMVPVLVLLLWLYTERFVTVISTATFQ